MYKNGFDLNTCSKDGRLKIHLKNTLKIFTVVILVIFIVVSVVLRSTVKVVIFIETLYSSSATAIICLQTLLLFCCTLYTVQLYNCEESPAFSSWFSCLLRFLSLLSLQENQYVIYPLASNVVPSFWNMLLHFVT